MSILIHYCYTLFILLCSFVLGLLFFVLNNRCIDFSVLEHYNPGRPSIVLDDEGNEWTRFQLDRREPIKLEQMPPHLIQSFIAAEDWNFFHHAGISLKGIIRSIVVNVYHGRIVQGASTITQQLVKLLFFDSQKTFKRKIKEQLFALLIERQFTKEQILETYLNHVYFGCGIYGVEAASQRFWGKSVQDITLDEAAVLAGIVRSPGKYSPVLYPLSAEKRRNVILRSMVNMDSINDDEYQQAKAMLLVINSHDTTVMAPHLKESLRILLEEQLGKATLYCGGLIIQTTLNRHIQTQAERYFQEHCARLKHKLSSAIDGALISMDVKTGEIKALIGGIDFNVSKFNRALQARRQIGSIFKPIVYAAALQTGMSFADTEVDEPITIENANKIWQPHNFNLRFNGEVTLAYALSHSNNIVTIKTLLRIGTDRIITLAKKCNIQGPFYPYPSLALGCVDATLKEAIGMFNIFANNGEYVEPHYLKWIKDRLGTKVYKSYPKKEQAIDARTSGQITKVLGIGFERVRKLSSQDWIDCEGISKTGTTNDSRTCWFIGATPTLTTAIYIGCDDNRSMGKNVFPSRTVFPIWKSLYRSLPVTQNKFSYDPLLRERIIHEKTGKQLFNMRDPAAITIFV